MNQSFLDTSENLYRLRTDPNCHPFYSKFNCQDPKSVGGTLVLQRQNLTNGTTEDIISWPHFPLVTNTPSETGIWSQNVKLINFDPFHGWLYVLVLIDEIIVGTRQDIGQPCPECICPVPIGTDECELTFAGGPRLETTLLKISGFPSQRDLFIPEIFPPCPEGDGDGFADCDAILGCDPLGHLCGDCDDQNAEINPRGDEKGKNSHDGIDNDCNGIIDG